VVKEVSVDTTPEREHLVELRQILTTRFDAGELRTICFDLGIDYDDLPGAAKTDKIKELVVYLECHNRTAELVKMGKQLRPDISWVFYPLEATKEAPSQFQSLPPEWFYNPLSIAELSPESPVYVLLQDIRRARSHSNWEEVLRLCDAARKHAREHRDQAGNATTLLYLADAQTCSGRLEKGIATAERARQNFEMQRDHHNMIIAHLVLARLKAQRSLDDARLEYMNTLDRCRDLESKAKENAQSKGMWFYERIIEGIEQVLKDVDQVIHVLQLSDGPDMIFGPSETIDYSATGEFTIERYAEEITYFLYSLDEAERDTLELEVGTIYFALPVPENRWLDPGSEKGDYALVRQETPINWKEPGVISWAGENWVAGRFERDPATREIHFEPPSQQPDIIGMGRVIALFKPKPVR
jgi:hypothetical protein